MCSKMTVRLGLLVMVSLLMAHNAITRAQQLHLEQIQTLVDYGGVSGRGYNVRADDGVAVWYNQIDSEHTKIQAYDFNTQQFYTVRSASSSYYEVSSPDVSGRTVVWSERSSVPGQSSTINNLRSFDLDTQQVTVLTNSVGDKWQPTIESGTVAWEQIQNGNCDLYRAQMPSFTPQAVASDPNAFEGNNDISQGKLLYSYYNFNTGMSRLRVLNLRTGQLVLDRNTSSPGTPPRVRLEGNYAMWSDSSALHVLNITSNQEVATLTNAADADLSTSLLVYYDYSNRSICARDLASGSTSVLVSSIYLSGVNDLAIDGNRLTWAEAYVPGTYSRDRIMSAQIVPEPSTLALLGIGVFSLLAYAWRRK
jgi:hypothetical protein